MIDVLAARLGIHLGSDRSGQAITTSTIVGSDTVTLTLFKPSESSFPFVHELTLTSLLRSAY